MKIKQEFRIIKNIEDHIHLLIALKPSHRPSDIIYKIKGSSSHYINSSSQNTLYWQNGYGIFSLSKKGIPIVKKYIQNQKEHHKNNSIITKLENY